MRPYYYLKSRAPEQAVVPIKEFQDPVNRQRVSQPQSLIDPDGPDVVTLVAINNTGGSLTVQARLSWTEAQA